MKRLISVIVSVYLLSVFLTVPSFSKESPDVDVSVPWSWMYSPISAVNEGFQIISFEGNNKVDLFLIPLQRQVGNIPEIWHLGLSMKKGDKLAFGISWTPGLIEDEMKGPRDENLIENRIPWGTYGAMAWKESMEIPQTLHWGIFYRPESDLLAEAGLSYTQWSRYSTDNNFSFNYGNQSLQDTLGIQLGLIYSLNQTMNIQAGYIFDPSPIGGGSSFRGYTPYDRHILRFGTGYRRGELDMSLSYMFLLYENSGQQTGSSASDPFMDEEDASQLELKVQYRF